MLVSGSRNYWSPRQPVPLWGYLQILHLELLVPNTYSKSSFQEAMATITPGSDICQFYYTL